MKKDEMEIEEAAINYFKNTKRSVESRQELFQKIYNNNEFVLKIVSKAVSKYNNEINDIKQLKHDAILEAMITAEEKYEYEKSPFIHYFSSTLKFVTENIIKEQKKKNEELFLDSSISREEENGLANKALIESTVSSSMEVDDEIYCDKFFNTLLNSLNRLYLSTKAGRENKSKVYAYFVLECLLIKSDKVFGFYINSYDFLESQKQILLDIRKQFKKDREMLTQKEYSKIAGIAESKFSNIRIQMEQFLRNDIEMQNSVEGA